MTKRQANTDAVTLAAMRDQYQHILSGIPRDTELAGAINAAAVLMAEAVVELEKVARLSVDDGGDWISDDQMRRRVEGVEYMAAEEALYATCTGCAFFYERDATCQVVGQGICTKHKRMDKSYIIWKRADEVTV